MPDDAADRRRTSCSRCCANSTPQGVQLIWVEEPPAGPEWDGVRDRLQPRRGTDDPRFPIPVFLRWNTHDPGLKSAGRAPSSWRPSRRPRCCAAACGGSGDTDDSFDPRRLIVFGDEASAPTRTPAAVPGPAASQPALIGSKYSINTLDTEATDSSPAEDLEPKAGDPANRGSGFGNCVSARLWIEILADEYGFGFEQCKDEKPVRAFTFAEPGATVAGVKAQIDAFLQSDDSSSLRPGRHRRRHQLHPPDLPRSDQRLAMQVRPLEPGQLRQRGPGGAKEGGDLADAVARVADKGDGGRVLFVTVPNQGDTPFARGENRTHVDFDRRDCLEQLTDAFNGGLRAEAPMMAASPAVAFAEDIAAIILDEPDDFDYDNTTDAACTTPSPDDPARPGVRADLPALLKCTTESRIDDAKSNRYFWAGPLNFTFDLQDELATRRCAAPSETRSEPGARSSGRASVAARRAGVSPRGRAGSRFVQCGGAGGPRPFDHAVLMRAPGTPRALPAEDPDEAVPSRRDSSPPCCCC